MWSGAKVCESCRARKMLKNAYLDAKIGFDTAENEPSEICGIGSWYMYLKESLYLVAKIGVDTAENEPRKE